MYNYSWIKFNKIEVYVLFIQYFTHIFNYLKYLSCDVPIFVIRIYL